MNHWLGLEIALLEGAPCGGLEGHVGGIDRVGGTVVDDYPDTRDGKLHFGTFG